MKISPRHTHAAFVPVQLLLSNGLASTREVGQRAVAWHAGRGSRVRLRCVCWPEGNTSVKSRSGAKFAAHDRLSW